MTLPGSASESELFHEGVALFNEGQWFEAHEAWEDLWRLTPVGPYKEFFQGLIQLAVVLEHVRRGNPRGVRSVWASATPKFVGLPRVCMGIDVPELLWRMRRFVQPVLDLPAECFAAGAGRGLNMPVDWAHAPKIELRHDPTDG